jgi:hypothetical protein
MPLRRLPRGIYNVNIRLSAEQSVYRIPQHTLKWFERARIDKLLLTEFSITSTTLNAVSEMVGIFCGLALDCIGGVVSLA